MAALQAVAQEALFNAWRHASPATISIRVKTRGSEVEIEVADDGSGFDSSRPQPPRERGASVGLIGLRERVAACGGRFKVYSQPGKGTRVTARFNATARSGAARISA